MEHQSQRTERLKSNPQMTPLTVITHNAVSVCLLGNLFLTTLVSKVSFWTSNFGSITLPAVYVVVHFIADCFNEPSSAPVRLSYGSKSVQRSYHIA